MCCGGAALHRDMQRGPAIASSNRQIAKRRRLGPAPSTELAGVWAMACAQPFDARVRPSRREGVPAAGVPAAGTFDANLARAHAQVGRSNASRPALPFQCPCRSNTHTREKHARAPCTQSTRSPLTRVGCRRRGLRYSAMRQQSCWTVRVSTRQARFVPLN